MTTSQNTSKRIWTKDEILDAIMKNDAQVAKALVKLYDYQTSTEQNAKETIYHNRVGFNGVDGKFLSSLAEFYKRNNYLSAKQTFRARKSLKKYAAQLARIVNGVQETPEEPVNLKSRKLSLSHWSR